MRRFSERIGVVSPRDTFQKNFMDERLWSRLWTAMNKTFWKDFSRWLDHDKDDFTRIIIYKIQDEFLGKPIDEIDDYTENFLQRLKSDLNKKNWAQFYDLAQFLADFSKIEDSNAQLRIIQRRALIFIHLANEVLEAEKSAYRFVAGELIEITDDVEIEEIEQALEDENPFPSVREHLRTALSLFGNRENPDYRNAIKEAISSVESTFSAINQEKSSSLPSAIGKAEKAGLEIPPALKEGIKKIYGWTSDENGVRHALFDGEARVGEAEARLMIVMCASLVNFLIIRSQETGR